MNPSSLRTSQASYGDRFIPNRAVTNMNIAEALLSEPTQRPPHNNPEYQQLLRDTILQGRTRILCFTNKPPKPTLQPKKKYRAYTPTYEETWDLPDIVGENRFNVLDWGSRDILAIAYSNGAYLLTNGSFYELMTTYEEVASVSWAADGFHVAVGFNDTVEVYDAITKQLIITLHDIHLGPVGSLAWNNDLLTTASSGKSEEILNHDLRIQTPAVSSYHGHDNGVRRITWSSSGMFLASGGNDKFVKIWDLRHHSPVYEFRNLNAPVRGVDWCPFEDNLVAAGGGETDRYITLWSASTGSSVKSEDTGSPVTGLLWSRSERELFTSHGYEENEIVVWNYEPLVKTVTLHYSAPMLYLTQSPDGCRLAFAARDEGMNIWRISDKPAAKNKKKKKTETPNLFGPSNRHIR